MRGRPEPALVEPPAFEVDDVRPGVPPPLLPPERPPPLLLPPLLPPPRPPPPLRRSRVWSGETSSEAGTTRRSSRTLRAFDSGIDAALIACAATRPVRNCENFMVKLMCEGDTRGSRM